MAWYSFRVDLPDIGIAWKDVEFTVYSVWGNGNAAKDMWGWPGRLETMSVTNALLDPDTSNPYCVVTLDPSTGGDPPNGHYFTFSSRCIIGDKHMVLGAFHEKDTSETTVVITSALR